MPTRRTHPPASSSSSGLRKNAAALRASKQNGDSGNVDGGKRTKAKELREKRAAKLDVASAPEDKPKKDRSGNGSVQTQAVTTGAMTYAPTVAASTGSYLPTAPGSSTATTTATKVAKTTADSIAAPTDMPTTLTWMGGSTSHPTWNWNVWMPDWGGNMAGGGKAGKVPKLQPAMWGMDMPSGKASKLGKAKAEWWAAPSKSGKAKAGKAQDLWGPAKAVKIQDDWWGGDDYYYDDWSPSMPQDGWSPAGPEYWVPGMNGPSKPMWGGSGEAVIPPPSSDDDDDSMGSWGGSSGSLTPNGGMHGGPWGSSGGNVPGIGSKPGWGGSGSSSGKPGGGMPGGSWGSGGWGTSVMPGGGMQGGSWGSGGWSGGSTNPGGWGPGFPPGGSSGSTPNWGSSWGGGWGAGWGGGSLKPSPNQPLFPPTPVPFAPPTGKPSSASAPSAKPTVPATIGLPTYAPSPSIPTYSPTSGITTYSPTPGSTTTAPTPASPTAAPTAGSTTDSPTPSGGGDIPTFSPTSVPTGEAANGTTSLPTQGGGDIPTFSPTATPTAGGGNSSIPTFSPTAMPSNATFPAVPTLAPTMNVTASIPTPAPSNSTVPPTISPSPPPTNGTDVPSSAPSNGTYAPSFAPSEGECIFPKLNEIISPDSDVYEGAFFGASVGVDRRTIVVGVQEDDNGVGSAAVYRYDGANQTFFQEAKLTPSDGEPTDDFGRAVAISDNFIIVGAQKNDAAGTDSGAAYIYARTPSERMGGEWAEVIKIVAPDAQDNERFGISVALDKNVAIIGANGADDNGENSGAAYIFTYVENEWVFTQKLLAPDGEAGDNFGFSVAIYGDQAVVGAVWDAEKSGSVYVFILNRGVWTVEGKFVADGGKPDDQFGWSVAMWEQTIAVGAFADDTSGLDSGAVYIFEKDSNGVWDQQARIAPSDGEENDHFGRSVDVHRDWLIVSSPFDDEVGIEAGSVYIYQRDDNEWLLQNKLFPLIDPTDFNEFGFGVAVSDDFFVASSKLENETLSDAIGNVYVYQTYCAGEPTGSPTTTPYPTTEVPTFNPTISHAPSISLVPSITSMPTNSSMPTILNSSAPTNSPTFITVTPTVSLTFITVNPTNSPTYIGTEAPSTSPTNATTPPLTTYAPTEPAIPTAPPTPFTPPPQPTAGALTPAPTTYFPTSTEPTSLNVSVIPTLPPGSYVPVPTLPPVLSASAVPTPNSTFIVGTVPTPPPAVASSPFPSSLSTILATNNGTAPLTSFTSPPASSVTAPPISSSFVPTPFLIGTPPPVASVTPPPGAFISTPPRGGGTYQPTFPASIPTGPFVTGPPAAAVLTPPPTFPATSAGSAPSSGIKKRTEELTNNDDASPTAFPTTSWPTVP
ncbi:hypothetical protein HJC23_000920 [Cyclotella cryptica]|uniref:Integrin alpha beta-propellor repeat protein n=1 Tax=Cyclotella cryptica TaxID=29204 RepID=A0ABD3QMQ1_9STRA